MMPRALLVAGLVAAAVAAPPRAQEPADDEALVERERVLAVTGKVDATHTYPLFPLKDGVGRLFVQPILQGGALGLRFHFRAVDPLPEDPTWGIQIRDAEGDVAWSYWAIDHWRLVAQGHVPDGFWSNEISGSRAVVEVYATGSSSRPKLEIDRVAIETEPIVPQAIIGRNQMATIVGQDPWIVETGKSVARLRFITDSGKKSTCTGFLLAGDLLLTNEHCLSSATEANSTEVDFDYDWLRAPKKTYRVVKLELTDFALDYAVARLERDVERPPLLRGTGPATEGQELLIIQHPGGFPKKVSIDDCVVEHLEEEGRDHELTDFSHLCDTNGGSSGAPVLDRRTHATIGLHHLRYPEGSDRPFNRAVPLGAILDDIAARDAELFRALGRADGG